MMPKCKLTAQSLSEWFATEQGGYVLAREQAIFDRTVSDIFGYNALQLGLPEHDFLCSSRVLMPEGSLIISGFNPRSLWGMRRALGCKQGYPWNGHFIALPRLKDWLALLGFDVAGGGFAAYAPPFRQTKWLERHAFMEAAGDRWWAVRGGVYFLHAIKRVHGMRLIKPQWNERLVSKLLPVAPKLNNKITQRNETDSQ